MHMGHSQEMPEERLQEVVLSASGEIRHEGACMCVISAVVLLRTWGFTGTADLLSSP